MVTLETIRKDMAGLLSKDKDIHFIEVRADTLDEAIDGAYEGVAKISFKDMHFRHDIGRTLG